MPTHNVHRRIRRTPVSLPPPFRKVPASSLATTSTNDSVPVLSSRWKPAVSPVLDTVRRRRKSQQRRRRDNPGVWPRHTWCGHCRRAKPLTARDSGTTSPTGRSRLSRRGSAIQPSRSAAASSSSGIDSHSPRTCARATKEATSASKQSSLSSHRVASAGENDSHGARSCSSERLRTFPRLQRFRAARGYTSTYLQAPVATRLARVDGEVGLRRHNAAAGAVSRIVRH